MVTLIVKYNQSVINNANRKSRADDVMITPVC